MWSQENSEDSQLGLIHIFCAVRALVRLVHGGVCGMKAFSSFVPLIYFDRRHAAVGMVWQNVSVFFSDGRSEQVINRYKGGRSLDPLAARKGGYPLPQRHRGGGGTPPRYREGDPPLLPQDGGPPPLATRMGASPRAATWGPPLPPRDPPASLPQSGGPPPPFDKVPMSTRWGTLPIPQGG